MTVQRILSVFLVFITIATPVMAGSYRQDGVRNCITWHKNFQNTTESMCKIFKCSGPSNDLSDAEFKRDCVCEDGVLQARLSPDDYNMYQSTLMPSDDKQFSKEEETYYQKNIAPVVNQAEKACGLKH